MQPQHLGGGSVVNLPERVDSVTCPEARAVLDPSGAVYPRQLICQDFLRRILTTRKELL